MNARLRGVTFQVEADVGFFISIISDETKNAWILEFTFTSQVSIGDESEDKSFDKIDEFARNRIKSVILQVCFFLIAMAALKPSKLYDKRYIGEVDESDEWRVLAMKHRLSHLSTDKTDEQFNWKCAGSETQSEWFKKTNLKSRFFLI